MKRRSFLKWTTAAATALWLPPSVRPTCRWVFAEEHCYWAILYAEGKLELHGCDGWQSRPEGVLVTDLTAFEPVPAPTIQFSVSGRPEMGIPASLRGKPYLRDFLPAFVGS